MADVSQTTLTYEQAYAEWCAQNPPSPWAWRDAFDIVRFDPERAAAKVIRAGDHVLHRPSGETWVVCRVRHNDGRVATFGWPPSEALITDCDLIYACTDAEHAKAVADCERIGR